MEYCGGCSIPTTGRLGQIICKGWTDFGLLQKDELDSHYSCQPWICLIFLKFQCTSFELLGQLPEMRHSLIYLFMFVVGRHNTLFFCHFLCKSIDVVFIILCWLFITGQDILFKCLYKSANLCVLMEPVWWQWEKWGCKRPGYVGQLQDHLLV